jgi:hypothetical protein
MEQLIIRQEVFKFLAEQPYPLTDGQHIVSFEVKNNELDTDRLHEGRHELGEGKWINDTHHINLNERVDSSVYLLEHPTIQAISTAHYHRQGYKYAITVYLKEA